MNDNDLFLKCHKNLVAVMKEMAEGGHLTSQSCNIASFTYSIWADWLMVTCAIVSSQLDGAGL